jgi:hypothetical protein
LERLARDHERLFFPWEGKLTHVLKTGKTGKEVLPIGYRNVEEWSRVEYN